MARKLPPSYEAMMLVPSVAEAPAAEPALSRSTVGHSASGQTLKEVSAHLMLYVHPDAAKALQRYALDQSMPGRKVKVHDLLLEAVEDWFRRHGLREPVRAKTERGEGR